MKKRIYMRVLDWWIEDNEKNFYDNPLIKILLEKDKYDIVYSRNPDFIIYSSFGEEHLKYDCVRIFFTHENHRTDWAISDYGIDFDFMDFNDRHLRLPLSFLNEHLYSEILNNRNIKGRDKFCGMVVSNGISKERLLFFDILGRYKKVDSGGRWNNNIGGAVKDKIEWLRGYKFNICFENASYPGYLTEKLFDSFLAGCIPVYWGDTSLRCHLDKTHKTITQTTGGGGVNTIKIYGSIPNISRHFIEYFINPKSFINAHNFHTMEELADEVKRIDNDNNAYMAMLQESIFLDSINPFDYYKQKTFDFLDNILSQEKPYRRPLDEMNVRSQKQNHTINSIAKKIDKYSKKNVKLALGILNTIECVSHLPRSIGRGIKHLTQKPKS